MSTFGIPQVDVYPEVALGGSPPEDAVETVETVETVERVETVVVERGERTESGGKRQVQGSSACSEIFLLITPSAFLARCSVSRLYSSSCPALIISAAGQVSPPSRRCSSHRRQER